MLNQHHEIHASTTSPIADLIGIVEGNWSNISQSLIEPDPGQYGNIITGIIQGGYKHIDKNVIVDKNRLWPRYHDITTRAFIGKPKIICTVRNIPDILASYILLIEKNKHKITYIDQDLIEMNLAVNNKNRCKILWEKYITHPYTSLRIGVNSKAVDILFLEYEDIVSQGQQTMDRVCDFIGIDSYQLDAENLQRMDENDKFHGGLEGLHDVRARLEKVSPPPEKVIGYELANHYKNMKLEFWKKL
jgi:hypothetical protein